MRRRLYRLLAWLSLLAALGVVIHVASREMQREARAPDGVSTSLAYAIRPGQSIHFALNAPDRQLRLLTNAALAAGTDPEGDERHIYAIDYALVSDSDVLREGRYWFRGRGEFLLDKAGARLPINRYGGEAGLAVLSTQLSFLGYADVSGAEELRLTLAEVGPGMQEVAVRVYAHQPVAEARVASGWLRLSAAQQAELADRTTYGAELLDAQEKTNLVRNRWRPLGPRGAAGDQYTDRRLNSLDAGAGDLIRDAVVPAGIVMDAQRRALIAIPPGEGEIELLIERAPSQVGPAAADGPVIARWFGATAQERVQIEIAAAARPQRVRRAWAPGLIELESREPLVVRAWRVAGERREVLTDAHQYLRLYRLDAQTPLEFEIAHDGSRATPLRLDLRRVLGASVERVPQQPTVRYALLDADSQMLGQGEIEVSALPSVYDQLVSAPGGGNVGEPVRQFFSLPPAVRRLRLLGDASVHAVAYTRPDDLPFRLSLPDDTQPWRSLAEQSPAWFLLPPRDGDARVREASTTLIEWQRRPPEWTRQDAGALAWRDFNPDGAWSGHSVLVEQAPVADVSAEALASRYRPLPRGREQTFEFRAITPGLGFTPDLIAVGAGARGRVRVFWDGQLVSDSNVGGDAVRIPLPEIAAGRHRLRVEAERGEWFVNHTGGAASRHLLRFAARLAPGATLRYTIDKTSDAAEPLSAQLFAAPGAAVHVRTRLTGLQRTPNQPLAEWTHGERRFEVQGLDALSGWLMQERAPRVQGSGYLLMPLNGDLPRGRYSVEVTHERGPEAHLLVYRVGEEQAPVRVIRARVGGESRD